MISHRELIGANGVRLHAAEMGREGPLMLFLQGFPECWQAWHRQLPEFARDHRAVALDLRGYNLSDKPSSTASYILAKLVEDVRCVIHPLSPRRRVILVDMTGAASRRRALRVHREIARPAQMLASSHALFFQLPVISDFLLRAGNFALLRKMIFGTTVRPEAFGPSLRQAYHVAWSKPGALSAGLKYYRNVRDFRAALKDPATWKIRIPPLVLWGEQALALRTSNLDGLNDWVSPLNVQRHPTATHWIVYEEQDWVNRAIRDFITIPPVDR